MKKQKLILGILFAAAIIPPVSSKPQSSIDSAITLFNQAHYAEARNLLRAEIYRTPNNPALYYWLGKCDFELFDNDAAITNAERAVQLQPNNSQYHYFLGTTYGHKAESANPFTGLSLARKAEHEFTRAVELDPHDMDAQRDLISYCIDAPGFAGGGLDRAEDRIAKLDQIDPLQAHLARLELYANRKKWGEAIQEANSVIAAKPKDAPPYLEVVEYYKDREQAAEMRGALAAIPRAINADPHVDYYRGVADILAEDRPDEAETFIKTYLSNWPPPRREDHAPLAEAHFWLGRLAEQRGRRQDAIAEYRMAIKLDSHNKSAHDALRRMGM